MPRAYSANYKRAIQATASIEQPVLLLEIAHAGLTEPIRVVNDTQDLTGNGNLFKAMAFRATLPDEQDGSMPRAKLSVDNVGRELVGWLESSQGGTGAEVRMMQLLRSAPDVIEWEITMDLTNVQIDVMQVSGSLGFDDLLNKPAVTLTYRPDTAPGLF